MSRYVCNICGYVYDEDKGIPEAGIAPGTKWEDLPSDWSCPICGAAKSEFTKQEDEKPAQKPVAPVASAPAAKVAGDMAEMSALELSQLCSNLARGCEKQYKADEAKLFTELATYFKGIAPAAEAPETSKLVSLVEGDLATNLPAARKAAEGDKDRGALRAITWCEKVTAIQKSLLARYQAEGDAMLANTGVYVCTICGFIYIGDNPPELCPVCKVPSWKFVKIEGRAS